MESSYPNKCQTNVLFIYFRVRFQKCANDLEIAFQSGKMEGKARREQKKLGKGKGNSVERVRDFVNGGETSQTFGFAFCPSKY
jgi:hypothetical protein